MTQVSVSQIEWDRFVDRHPGSTLYHTWRWTQLAADAFGFQPSLMTEHDAAGNLVGVLPLVLQTSRLFGRRLVSLPFLNYGGPLGLDRQTEERLLDQAAREALRLKARVLEIRDRVERPGHTQRTDKVTLELALPADSDSLAKALGAKLRSQIRRCDRENPVVITGGAELVDEFHGVFAETMRDLGTPVLPRHFFHRVLARLRDDCTLIVVRIADRPAAAALLTHYRERTEIPWAASRSSLRATGVNMRLYWECLQYAMQRGSTIFDFGRSTAGSGTYRFKLQWGARPRPLYWIYPLQPVATAQTASHPEQTGLVQRVWSRLPLSVANRIGPLISPGLPW